MFNLAHWKKKIDQIPVDKKFGNAKTLFGKLRRQIKGLHIDNRCRQGLEEYLRIREEIMIANAGRKAESAKATRNRSGLLLSCTAFAKRNA